MKRYIVFLETGYCGEDSWDITELTPDDEADLWELALENARQFDHSNEYEEDEEYDEDEDIADRVSYDIVEYDPVEHDMYRCGGGSFTDDFSES
jgi:hypothetical protein